MTSAPCPWCHHTDIEFQIVQIASAPAGKGDPACAICTHCGAAGPVVWLTSDNRERNIREVVQSWTERHTKDVEQGLRVIFLDIDGVLNAEGSPGGLQSDKVMRLKRIIEETGAEIVLSSTWRTEPDLVHRVEVMLDKIGGRLLDQTPVIGDHCFATARGQEIKAWLDDPDKPLPETFVILDDDPDMSLLGGHLVLTETHEGLTDAQAEEVIRRFSTGQRTCVNLRHRSARFSQSDPKRDWPEDFGHENGNYMNVCGFCGHPFTGHKRRVVCRKCSEQPAEANVNDDEL